MQAFVVSNKESLRTEYFIKAGDKEGVNTLFITYNQLVNELTGYNNALIKLEPPIYNTVGFVEYTKLCSEYLQLLDKISKIEKSPDVYFLNEPSSIITTLDKKLTKEKLNGLDVTPMLGDSISTFDQLVSIMDEKRKYSVFIKPNFASGAGGIIALRLHPKTKNAFAYTTLGQKDDFIFNTNRTGKLSGINYIRTLVNFILGLGAIVEEWIPKETVNGENFDLRVVCQFGKVEHIVVRCSRGAITNLHLNNNAQNFSDLNLSDDCINNIIQQSLDATNALNLNYAGVDVLIKKGTEKATIIEVNGQGDHIYQDMFNNNKIYRNQLRHNPKKPI